MQWIHSFQTLHDIFKPLIRYSGTTIQNYETFILAIEIYFINNKFASFNNGLLSKVSFRFESPISVIWSHLKESYSPSMGGNNRYPSKFRLISSRWGSLWKHLLKLFKLSFVIFPHLFILLETSSFKIGLPTKVQVNTFQMNRFFESFTKAN